MKRTRYTGKAISPKCEMHVQRERVEARDGLRVNAFR